MKCNLRLCLMIAALALCVTAPVVADDAPAQTGPQPAQPSQPDQPSQPAPAQPSQPEQRQQVAQYNLGDQTMSINAGLFIPLFLLGGSQVTWLFQSTSSSVYAPHLSLGAVGSISWAAYITPQIRIGADIAGNFTLSPNVNTLLMLPFIAKVSYIFSAYPFEIPLSFGVGMNIIKYVDDSTIDLLLRPGAGLYWVFNSSWSFGVNLNYWFDMQFAANAADSRQGNFLEVSLGALYHY